MGDLPQLSPEFADLPRPVYAMHAIRSLDGLRDDLLLTHAESDALYVLSTQPADRSSDPAFETPTTWESIPTDVIITEVQVLNGETLADADGEAQPWVELYNKGTKSVSLGGWTISADNDGAWTLPPLQLEPGRFAVVFLSGKDRSGNELHADFAIDDQTERVTLTSPGGPVHGIDLEEHSVADISYGLASVGDVRWFDLPSPGASNNAGFRKLSDVRVTDNITQLIISPKDPAPGQKVQVTVTTPSTTVAEAQLKDVWFSVVDGLEEKHYPLKRQSAGVYSSELEAGAYTNGDSHRILARYREHQEEDDGQFTLTIHPGLDDRDPEELFEEKEGRLLQVASVPSPQVKAFDIAPVTSQVGKGALPDLVYADDVCGLLRVHRGVATAQRFELVPTQDLQVRGAPRDVKLADIDNDGWLDATVVLRGLDLALTCGNDNGVLRAIGELPTGESPRAVAMADFNSDGLADAAVINRYSADVSILTTSEGVDGLVSNDQIYPVDGEVAGLRVEDYNNDGRDDVIQLHRSSGEVSVRYADPDGLLSEPEFLRVNGELPSGIASADLNGDGLLDTVTANLGFNGRGSVSVMMSQPDGTRIAMPSIETERPMFAISVADFDNDGNPDLITGLFDCRVSFFRGDGTGNFTYTRTQQFAYESRVMVVADFDQDGDIDVAGSWADRRIGCLDQHRDDPRLTRAKGRLPAPFRSILWLGADRDL